jgi:UDP-N-acetylmuramoyl-tripeptide--D-alanyl-D-alanine ligase
MMRSSTFRLSGEFVAESCGGRIVQGDAVVADAGASIDTRTLRERQVFFAVRGERSDGHDYLAQAVRAGATGLVVAGARVPDAIEAAALNPGNVFIVAVDDPTTALGETAASWITVLGPIVVGVTGSVGKTTTKEMIAAVLRRSFEVHATSGNFNNHLGLPLTLLQTLPRHEVLVAEMGMSGRGEIAHLCRIAHPRIGVVTTVAPVHVEHLGSIEAIAEAKAELVDALPSHGVAVLNADDPRVAAMAGRSLARVTTFGWAGSADVRIVDVALGPDGRPAAQLVVDGVPVEVRLSMVGGHFVLNAAAAIACGRALGVDPVAAAEALASVPPGKHRMDVVSAGTLRVLDDCYNASPLSLSAALRTLADLPAAGRRVAVVGDMLELGVVSDEAHRSAGVEAAGMGVDCLIAVGRNAGFVREGALSAGLSSAAVFTAPDAIAAATLLVALAEPRDTILVKGSRGVGLEHVVEAVRSRFGGDEAGN